MTQTSSDISANPDRQTRFHAAAATPMMAQYIEIKTANPDSLLFYRMGDFYELFFEDAVEASRALGITLTKRGQHAGEDIPMCGVPVHAADDYLQKLIGLGFRVAVCEQTESPAEAKKRGAKSVVKREVVRLVTPGTITEERLLEPGEASILMAIGHIKSDADHYALAFIDMSTGLFRLTLSSFDTLVANIHRIDPREIILADGLYRDDGFRPVLDLLRASLSPQPASFFDSGRAEERLSDHFGIATLDSLGDFSRAECAALSGILAYVEKTQLSERPPLQRPERDSESATVFIDPATRQNLEITRTLSGKREGSLLSAIDCTVTGGGKRLLTERLMSPLTNTMLISERQDSVAYVLAHPNLRDHLREALKSLPDMPRGLSRLALNRGGPRDLLAIRRGLQISGELATLLMLDDLPQELLGAKSALDILPQELTLLLGQALGDEAPLLARDGGFVRAGYHAELDEMRGLRDESRKIIAGLQAQYAEATGVKSLKIRHNNVLGYFIEVTALNSAALTEGDDAKAIYIHRQTLASAMRFTTTELAALETKIANAAGRAVEIELEIFEALRSAIVAAASPIRAASLAASVLDVSISHAELAESQGYARPLVDDSRDFEIIGGRHPVVEQALRRQASGPFIANDCNLSPQDAQTNGAIWLLTGPNMGGKSTFLRQNALIVLLAQMGAFVPAGSARIGVIDRLFSRVGASDDLAQGRSTFMVEMVETAAILNQATDRSFVILDEIGRGTATFDGLSIAWGAVEYLHEHNKCRSLFATHFHELTALSSRLERLGNVTMQVREHEGDVVFLHSVGEGSADRSYGIQVAKLAGLPPAVVSRAREVLDQLEEGDTGKAQNTLIDDLPLFSVDVPHTPAVPSQGNALQEALAEIDPDMMTPREALDALYALKQVSEK